MSNTVPDNETEKPPCTKRKISDDEKIVLETLIKYHTHYDVFVWQRLRYIAPLQGAVIAGAYHLRTLWLSHVLLLFGIGGTLLLYCLIRRDIANRDINVKVLESIIQKGTDGLNFTFKMSANPTFLAPRGRVVINIVVWAFIITDIALLLVFCHKLIP